MSTTIRRTLAVAGLVLASLAGSIGVGSTPAGAGVPSYCDGSPTYYVCRTYLAFFRRTISEAELDYWLAQLPARKTVMVATVGRAPESRRRMIEAYYRAYADRTAGDGEKSYWEGEVLKPNGFRRLEAALFAEFDGTAEDFVLWAYSSLLDREPGQDEFLYWEARAEATGYGPTAAALVATAEVRELRVHWSYWNELEEVPGPASVAYWSERLRTGTSYLDLRMALWGSSYPEVAGNCSSLAPPAESGCS